MQKTPDIIETLVRSLTELRALERFTLEALELQQHEDDLEEHRSAADLIGDITGVLRSHVDELDAQIAAIGGSPQALRAAATSMSGAFLGFLSKIRSHETAKMLRDDYTLLSLASVGYLMLHTTAVALRHATIATLAIRHHRDLAPLVSEIAETLPHLVLHDLSQSFGGLDRAAAETTLLACETPRIVTPWAVTA